MQAVGGAAIESDVRAIAKYIWVGGGDAQESAGVVAASQLVCLSAERVTCLSKASNNALAPPSAHTR